MRQKTEQQNLELLEQYFRAGCKREDEKKIGVELEHFVTERQTGRDISYYGAEGVGALLEEWKNQYPVKYHENGSLIGLACREYALSLEPAAQLEISISPQKELREIPKIYRKFLNTVGSSLDRRGYELLTTGYRRSAKADDLEMIPKRRYEYMDQYFRTSGSTGRMMMRGTASAQISVDYSSEDDFVRKYRALSVVMPMIKLLTDNTPCGGGESMERISRQNVDLAPCGSRTMRDSSRSVRAEFRIPETGGISVESETGFPDGERRHSADRSKESKGIVGGLSVDGERD